MAGINPNEINWDAVEKLRKENKVRFEIFKKRLKELGIDVNKKLYMELGCNDIQSDAEEFCWEFENINVLYENLPATTTGLSFHDIMTNEMAMMAIRWEDPDLDCLIKANEIFVHTFLDLDSEEE